MPSPFHKLPGIIAVLGCFFFGIYAFAAENTPVYSTHDITMLWQFHENTGSTLGWHKENPGTWEGVEWRQAEDGQLHVRKLYLTRPPLRGAIFLQGMPRLEEVVIYAAYELTGFTIENCPRLHTLAVSCSAETKESDGFARLTIKRCPSLQALNVSANGLTTLDIDSAKQIKTLDVNNNRLENIALELTPALTELTASYNRLTVLDIKKTPHLRHCNVAGNRLTTLDVSKNLQLQWLNVTGNLLTELDTSNNANLETLIADRNQITVLNTGNSPLLSSLSAKHNHLVRLDISKNTRLLSLEISSNQLEHLDLRNNTGLTHLVAGSMHLAHIDLSNNPQLEVLQLPKNKLNTLDVSNLTRLQGMDIAGNALETLDLRGLNNILWLHAPNNRLHSISMDSDFPDSLAYAALQNNHLPLSAIAPFAFVEWNMNLYSILPETMPCRVLGPQADVLPTLTEHPLVLKKGGATLDLSSEKLFNEEKTVFTIRKKNGNKATTAEASVKEGKVTFSKAGEYLVTMENPSVINDNTDRPSAVTTALIRVEK